MCSRLRFAKGSNFDKRSRNKKYLSLRNAVAQWSDHSLAVREYPGSNLVRTLVFSQCHFNLTGADGKERYRTSSTVRQHTEI